MKSIYLEFALALALTLTFTTLTTRANSWTNLYRLCDPRAIAVDSNGNVFVTGQSMDLSAGNGSDYVTIKYANEGTPLWTNLYNGTWNWHDIATDCVVDGAGNVIVTGHSRGNDNREDYATIKYANDGTPLWTNRYDGQFIDQAHGIAVDTSGNVFVTGYSYTILDASSADYLTVKYSSAGVALWTNRYNGPGNSSDRATDIALDLNGNVFVTGSSTGIGTGLDYATVKYANDGTPLWTNRYDGPANTQDDAYAIVVDSNGNVAVTGRSSATITIGDFDYATIEYSNNGTPLWTNRYNGPANNVDEAHAISVDAGGNVLVTGFSIGSGSGNDYATVKYSTNGTPIWTNRYNGPANSGDRAVAISVDSNGSVFVAGWSYGIGSVADYAMIQYSDAGVPLQTNRFNGLGNGNDYAAGIAVVGSDVFVTGGSGSDCVTVKYSAVMQNAILENPQVFAGVFSFDLVAGPGGQFIIEASTNLVNWNGIRDVIISAQGSTNIVETVAPSAGRTFYRAKRE